MPGQLVCQIEQGTPIVTVRLAGSLDITTATDLRRVLLKCLADDPTAIIVDLSGLIVVNDLCLVLFPAIARHAAEISGAPILLCAPSAPVDRMLQALTIDNQVTICATHDEAVERVAHTARMAPVRGRFSPTPTSVPQARMIAVQTCRWWGVGTEVSERVMVVVTELVTNSVKHARTPLELRLRCTERFIHVAVHDHDKRTSRLRPPEFPDEEGGRGLVIVGGLSQSWGCRPTPDGKVTWATVRRRPIGR